MPEKILITGSSGFIGNHLHDELVAHGYEVLGFDRNLPPKHHQQKVYWIGDILDTGEFVKALDKDQPDRVIHLAAQVGRLFGEDDVKHTITSNAAMTAIVAQACGERGIPMMYASTSEVYGDQGEATCDEDEGPFSLPHNLYGLSKLWGEEACLLYAPEGLQIIRPSMPYGPGAPPGRGRRALDNFIWHAQHGRKFPVHVGAERSWCWIGDAASAIRLIIESGEGGAFNVGRDDDPRPLIESAQQICELVGASYDLIDEVPAPARQTVVKRLSTQKIRDLGWEPKVEFDEGLKWMIEWISNFDADGNFKEASKA